MTTPIDLDLVELRCKLRGWQYERRDDDVGPLIEVDGPTWPTAIIHASGAISGGGLARFPFHWSRKVLTAPRLTLADIIADPGEGWRVNHHGFDGWIFELAKPGSTVLVKVGPRECHGHGYGCQPALSPRSPEVWGLDDTRDAVAHLVLVRVVTDLLIRLAEVSDV